MVVNDCSFDNTENVIDEFAKIFCRAADCFRIGHADAVEAERCGLGAALSLLGHGQTLHLSIAASCFARLKDRRRTLAGRTGCGLCGVENIADVVAPYVPPPAYYAPMPYDPPPPPNVGGCVSYNGRWPWDRLTKPCPPPT